MAQLANNFLIHVPKKFCPTKMKLKNSKMTVDGKKIYLANILLVPHIKVTLSAILF